ncbi:unnamed protein product [Enterobius vermicularis]|uniref:Girdin n=1 Tax=Enterobius vermicularis TaxID=51028 RepID=A0A0N4VDC1_ENTVE|nr:unnamed protein product [Enterobius vermicularis]
MKFPYGAKAFDYPFGSYVNATKQFEKSVNAVEKLLNTKPFALSKVKDNNPSKRTTESQKSENMKQLLDSMTEEVCREDISKDVMATKQPLSRAEEQIACLANMSTAKDMIIEEQKKSIKNLEQKLADEECACQQALDDLKKAENRCTYLEEELSLLKSLSDEQTCMKRQIAELRKEDESNRELIKRQKEEIERLQEKNSVLEAEAVEVKCKCDSLTKSLTEALDLKASLERKLDSFKPLAELRQLQDDKDALSYAEMYKELQETKDRNQRLEQELSINAEKNTHLNEICAQVFDENTALKEKCDELQNEKLRGEDKAKTVKTTTDDQFTNIQQENSELKKEIAGYVERLESQAEAIDSLTKEALNSENRAKKAEQELRTLEQRLSELEKTKQVRITESSGKFLYH